MQGEYLGLYPSTYPCRLDIRVATGPQARQPAPKTLQSSGGARTVLLLVHVQVHR